MTTKIDFHIQHRRNKFHLSYLLSKLRPALFFLQEHWLPQGNASVSMTKDFTNYNFTSTSSDMFLPAEDVVLSSGPTWHGTAIGWDRQIDRFICRIEHINERFCCSYMQIS